METQIPKTSEAISSLLRADLTTQWRNRRSIVLLLVLPVFILIAWKGLIEKVGGPFVLSTCLTLGLVSLGIMGYSNTIARDRDKGVFQRLRVTPVPTWSIMGSRLLVQLFLIIVLTIVVFVVGYQNDKIQLSPTAYALTLVASFLGGAVYLSLGQMIVGLVKNAETVNSTSRLVYFLFIMGGMLSDVLIKNKDFKTIVQWSPYGSVKTMLAASMQPANWNNEASMALLATVAYAAVFSYFGITKFKWNSQ